MPINRRSVTIMSSSGTAMNKYSDEAKADSYYGYTDGIHTIQVVYANYVGRLHLQGTLVLNPTATDWFDIVVDPTEGLYAGSSAWNDAGYIQFNADAPATKSNSDTLTSVLNVNSSSDLSYSKTFFTPLFITISPSAVA